MSLKKKTSVVTLALWVALTTAPLKSVAEPMLTSQTTFGQSSQVSASSLPMSSDPLPAEASSPDPITLKLTKSVPLFELASERTVTQTPTSSPTPPQNGEAFLGNIQTWVWWTPLLILLGLLLLTKLFESRRSSSEVQQESSPRENSVPVEPTVEQNLSQNDVEAVTSEGSETSIPLTIAPKDNLISIEMPTSEAFEVTSPTALKSTEEQPQETLPTRTVDQATVEQGTDSNTPPTQDISAIADSSTTLSLPSEDTQPTPAEQEEEVVAVEEVVEQGTDSNTPPTQDISAIADSSTTLSLPSENTQPTPAEQEEEVTALAPFVPTAAEIPPLENLAVTTSDTLEEVESSTPVGGAAGEGMKFSQKSDRSSLSSNNQQPISPTAEAITSSENEIPTLQPEKSQTESPVIAGDQSAPSEPTLRDSDIIPDELNPNPTITLELHKQDSSWVYASWEMSEAQKQQARQQGGEQLALRFYDVTQIDMDLQVPHGIQQFECAPDATDWYIQVPMSERDYIVEIGYITEVGRWLPLARSGHVYAPSFSLEPTEPPSPEPVEPEVEEQQLETESSQSPTDTTEADITTETLETESSQSPTDTTEADITITETSEDEDICETSVQSEITLELHKRDPNWVYASWEMSEAQKQQALQQGGEQLALRFYDVTQIDMDLQVPHGIQQFECAPDATEWYIQVPMSERDYIVEIGYVTEVGRWLRLARSGHVHAPTVPWEATATPWDLEETPSEEDEPSLITPAEETETEINQPATETTPVARAIAATDVIKALESKPQEIKPSQKDPQTATEVQEETEVTETVDSTVTPQPEQSNIAATKFNLGQADAIAELAAVDQGLPQLPNGYGLCKIVLLPIDPDSIYVYWDITNEDREELRQQGGKKLMLRVYDVTEVDMDTQKPHSMEQFDCDELAREWYISVPMSDRDYIVEIGYLTDKADWLLLARSLHVRIPPVYPSDRQDYQEMTVPWDKRLKQ